MKPRRRPKWIRDLFKTKQVSNEIFNMDALRGLIAALKKANEAQAAREAEQRGEQGHDE